MGQLNSKKTQRCSKRVYRRVASIVILFISVTSALYSQPRRGVIWNHGPIGVLEEDRASPFTLGTLASIGFAFSPLSEYRVNPEKIVYREREGSAFIYGVFALPSMTVGQFGDNQPISVILPVGILPGQDSDASAGFGLGISFGLNTPSKNTDIGIAAAVIGTRSQSLTDPQRVSFEAGTPLPDFVNREIGNGVVFGISVGLYIAPHF